ncbi:MAG: YncE family protein [Acidimicrobiia bacterium]
MASLRWSIRFVALVVLFAACTSNSQPAGPTAPADAFAPTPTIGELAPPTTRPAPTTTLDVDRTTVYPVDPVTLEALPGYSPIPMGDWAWGVSSPNGRWLALVRGDDTGGGGESLSGLALIDIPAWELAGEWAQIESSPMAVTDDGVIYTVSYSGPGPQLVRATVGSDPDVLAELSPGFSPWDLPWFGDDEIVLAGHSYGVSSTPGTMSVVTVDATSGTTVETPIPQGLVGPIEVIELESGRLGVVDSFPALTWAENEGRLLVVPPIEDLVIEFDTATRAITQHRFGGESDARPAAEISQAQVNAAEIWASSRRTAALSPDGRVMFVSGTAGKIVEEDGAAVSITTPSGILTIDTESWEVIDRLDAPISDLFLSPDGTRLLAGGYSEELRETRSVSESSGIFVLDPVGLEVLAHHPPGPAGGIMGQVSFSGDGSLAYVTTYAEDETASVIDLETGAILTERPGIMVFGEVATVADRGGAGR